MEDIAVRTSENQCTKCREPLPKDIVESCPSCRAKIIVGGYTSHYTDESNTFVQICQLCGFNLANLDYPDICDCGIRLVMD